MAQSDRLESAEIGFPQGEENPGLALTEEEGIRPTRLGKVDLDADVPFRLADTTFG